MAGEGGGGVGGGFFNIGQWYEFSVKKLKYNNTTTVEPPVSDHPICNICNSGLLRQVVYKNYKNRTEEGLFQEEVQAHLPCGR